MRVRVLFFAALRDQVGQASVDLDLPPEVQTVSLLGDHLEHSIRGLSGSLESVRFAVNEQFADASQQIHDGDVVALIPPVSGG
jgi:molybdopterin synthase sulfur carrier subunit